MGRFGFGRGGADPAGGFREVGGGPPVGRWLGSAVRAAWRVSAWPFAAAGRAVGSVRQTLFGERARGRRRGRDLLRGLPAVAALLLVGGLAAAVAAHADDRTADYRAAAAAAVERGDAEQARVLYERLAKLDGGTGDTLHALALAQSAAGRDAEAVRLMESLARPGRGGARLGEPRAHVWLADRILKGPDGAGRAADDPITPDELRLAVEHLRAALAGGLWGDGSVHERLAGLLLAAGAREPAVRPLREAAAARPALELDLAALLGSLGRTAEAQAAARRAKTHFAARLAADPADPAERGEARRGLTRAELLLGEGDAAVARLRAAAGDGSADAAERRTLAGLLVADARAVPDDEPGRRLALLRDALAADPRSAAALTALADVGRRRGAAGEEADRLLRDALAAGTAPAAVHLALGLRAIGGEPGGGDAAADDAAADAADDAAADDAGTDDAGATRAMFHFERALRLDPSLAIAANNLAYLLGARAGGPDDPDLGRALALVDGVLARYPGQPNLLDTRGGLLLKLGRPAEALDALEVALARSPNPTPALHRSLAAAYSALGRDDLAARHRAAAGSSDTVPTDTVPTDTVPTDDGPTDDGPTDDGPTDDGAAGARPAGTDAAADG